MNLSLPMIASIVLNLIKDTPADTLPDAVKLTFQVEAKLGRDLTDDEQNVVGITAAAFTVGHVKAQRDERRAKAQAELNIGMSALITGHTPALSLC